MTHTPLTETEALLLAIEDSEADSGNHEPLDEYLMENLMESEVWKLAEAADVLSDRAWTALQRKRSVSIQDGEPK